MCAYFFAAQRNVQRIQRAAQLALTNCAARTKRTAYFINMHKFIAFILVVLTLVF